MFRQPLSILEISRIVEQGLLPHQCRCTSRDGVTLDVQVTAADEPHRSFSVKGVPLAELSSSRAISKLVLEMRNEVVPGAQESEASRGWKLG